MKKILIGLLSALILLTGIAGCKTNIAGTWYSDRKNGTILLLSKDGTYTDGEWLTSGSYTVEGDMVILAGPLDGNHILHICKQGKSTILVYEDDDGTVIHTYFKTQEEADISREARQKAEEEEQALRRQEEEEEKAAEEEEKARQEEAELKAFSEALPGYWFPVIVAQRFPIEFRQDGSGMTYDTTTGVLIEFTYEVVKANSVNVTYSDGKTETMSISFIQEKMYININACFVAAEPTAISMELLAGTWIIREGGAEILFDAAGTYQLRDPQLALLNGPVVSFTILNENTITVPKTGKDYALFVAETDTQYYMLFNMIYSLDLDTFNVSHRDK